MHRLLIVLALAGCQRTTEAPPPTCAAVTKHIATILSSGLQGPGDVAQCEARKLTDAQKRCLLAANTTAQIAACGAGKSDEVPRVPPEAKGAPPSKTH